MKRCGKCGTNLPDDALFCYRCGSTQGGYSRSGGYDIDPAIYSTPTGEGYVWLTVLGFIIPIAALIGFFYWRYTDEEKAFAIAKGGLMSISISPIVGLILYVGMKNRYPAIARACGICAIIGVGISILTYALGIAYYLLY